MASPRGFGLRLRLVSSFQQRPSSSAVGENRRALARPGGSRTGLCWMQSTRCGRNRIRQVLRRGGITEK